MISYAAYKVVHLFGVLLLFAGLGGLCALALSGDRQPSPSGRKLLMIAHGVGLVVILVAGFGLLASLGLGASIPLWIWLKLVLWLALGGIVVLIKKSAKAASVILFLLPVLGAVAAYLAIYNVGTSSGP